MCVYMRRRASAILRKRALYVKGHGDKSNKH